MPLQCCMTLGKSLHLSVLLLIYKMGMNVTPASRVVGRTKSCKESLSTVPTHSKSSVVAAIWMLLRHFQSDGRKGQLNT